MTAKTLTLLRTRVTNALQEAVESYPLVVLTAPAGYGKTVAVRELMETTKRRVFYVNMPQIVHSDKHLWNAVFSQLAEQGSEICKAQQNESIETNHVFVQRVQKQWREPLQKSPSIVVFDDYHFMGSRELGSLVETFVRANIPNVCILLVSRARPSLPLEELRIKGLAAVLGQELLSFTEEETTRLFELYGLDEPEAAQLAWRFSEGWAAALWLSMQSYISRGVIEPIDDMEKLISETIFSNYDLEEQVLLLKFSLISSFTPKQAVLISGDPAAKARLRNLCDRNAFISYNSATDSYSLHSIFRNYLIDILEENAIPACREIDKIELYRRIAESSVEARDYLQAALFFHKAGRDEDFLRILQLFEMPDTRVFVTFDPDQIAHIVDEIPWRIRHQCPIGYLSFIYCFMYRVNLEKGSDMLREAEAHFADNGFDRPEMRQQIEGEIEVLRALESSNDFQAAFEHYQRAYDLLQGPSRIINAQKICLFNLCAGVFHLRQSGTYQKLLKLATEKTTCLDGLSGGLSAGVPELFHAEYMLETGSLYKVQYLLDKAERAIKCKGMTPNAMLAMLRSRLLMATGEFDVVSDVFAPFPEIERKPCRVYLKSYFYLAKTLVATICRRSDMIPDWLMTDESLASLSSRHYSEHLFILRGKAFVVEKDWGKLEALLEDARFSLLLSQDCAVIVRLHALVFSALLAIALKDREQGLRHLLGAVELAKKDSLVTSVAEYGLSVYPLLRKLQLLYPEDSFITVLAKLSKKYAKLSVQPDHVLSWKEQMILEKAIAGESNRIIGEDLGIRSGSVANSLSRIYTKLGVKNREEARKSVMKKSYASVDKN